MAPPGRLDGSWLERFAPLGRLTPEGICEALFPKDERLPVLGRADGVEGMRPEFDRDDPVEARGILLVEGRLSPLDDDRDKELPDDREMPLDEGRE